MTTVRPAPSWRKSTASNNSSDCVEVRGDLDAVRDSKNHAGPALTGIAVRALVQWSKNTIV
jgi:hypothetical protein